MQSEKEYAVVAEREWYLPCAQHPSGLSVSLQTRGTLDDCRDYVDDAVICLSSGQAGETLSIREIVDTRADYQAWLDSAVDWPGCPYPDGIDYDANCAWAEERAMSGHIGTLPIATDDGGLILVDMSRNLDA